MSHKRLLRTGSASFGVISLRLRLHVGLAWVQEALFDKQVYVCYCPAWCFLLCENRNVVVSDSMASLREKNPCMLFQALRRASIMSTLYRCTFDTLI